MPSVCISGWRDGLPIILSLPRKEAEEASKQKHWHVRAVVGAFSPDTCWEYGYLVTLVKVCLENASRHMVFQLILIDGLIMNIGF